MTVAHIYTVAFQGIDAREVDVQVHISEGGGTGGVFNIVGLADKAVGESRERVRAALSAIGLALPYQRITINLAPADLPKEGSHYDLPIALGLLAAMGVLPASELAGHVALGELSLDAQVTAVAGVLPAALAASEQGRGLICPAACGPEAAWAGGLEIIAAPSLIAIVNHMKGTQVLNPPEARLAGDTMAVPDLRDVKGQETAKRALEVAAAGGHNMLMIGPPRRGQIHAGCAYTRPPAATRRPRGAGNFRAPPANTPWSRSLASMSRNECNCDGPWPRRAQQNKGLIRSGMRESRMLWAICARGQYSYCVFAWKTTRPSMGKRNART